MKTIIKNLTIIMFLSTSMFANATVGSITLLKGDVKIHDKTSTVNASLGLKLYEENSILTGKKSKAQFIFNDETIVTVGKNSNFSISKFMYDESQEPTIKFGLIKGAIKTITGEIGKIAPQKFSVKTKTATIGIRGTNFTTSILDDKSLMAYCTYGAINVNYNGKDYLVKQGFYIVISPNGTVEVKEFNSTKLRDMSARLFGSMVPPKGKAKEDGAEPKDDMIIDETTEVVAGIVITDVTQEVQAKEQADKQDEINEHDDNPQSPAPAPAPVVDIIMNGFNIVNDRYTGMSTALVALKFTEDGSIFDTVNSFLEATAVGNSSGNGEEDDWKFTISATPDNFTSREDFSTNFSSVQMVPIGSSSSTNESLSPDSTFIATPDDLANGDYMSWGSWSADVTFTSNQSGTSMSDSHNFIGFWVSGEETDVAIVNAQTGTSVYNGIYRAIDFTNSNNTINGSATMNVDFGSDTATLNIATLNYDFTNISISGNSLNGNTVLDSGGTSRTGTVDGTFYGSNADGIGGNFQIEDFPNSVHVKGVYEVKR